MAACGLWLDVWPAANFEMRPAADLGALGLRPMDGVACGQKSGKILVENLRKYFRGVFVVSALFSQSDCLSFWIAKRRERGERGENWLAARVELGQIDSTIFQSEARARSYRNQTAFSLFTHCLRNLFHTLNCSSPFPVLLR